MFQYLVNKITNILKEGVTLSHDSLAIALGDALVMAIPAIEVKIVPTSVPVAAMGLEVHFTHDEHRTYIPALESWWTVGEDVQSLKESATPINASVNSALALVAFELGMYLIGAGLVVGSENAETGDTFAAAVTLLFDLSEDETDVDTASSAALYLALLNAELDEAQQAAE